MPRVLPTPTGTEGPHLSAEDIDTAMATAFVDIAAADEATAPPSEAEDMESATAINPSISV